MTINIVVEIDIFLKFLQEIPYKLENNHFSLETIVCLAKKLTGKKGIFKNL